VFVSFEDIDHNTFILAGWDNFTPERTRPKAIEVKVE